MLETDVWTDRQTDRQTDNTALAPCIKWQKGNKWAHKSKSRYDYGFQFLFKNRSTFPGLMPVRLCPQRSGD